MYYEEEYDLSIEAMREEARARNDKRMEWEQEVLPELPCSLPQDERGIVLMHELLD
jgi:hypothetical protein